jgi:hypothetical protein
MNVMFRTSKLAILSFSQHVTTPNFLDVIQTLYLITGTNRHHICSREFSVIFLVNRYNMKELGSCVAKRIMSLCFEENAYRDSVTFLTSGLNEVPTFLEPKALCCKLPGGYTFYTCQTPALRPERSDYLTEEEDELSVLSVCALSYLHSLNLMILLNM